MFWRILNFAKDFNSKHGPFDRVLDVGSFDINGSVKEVIPARKEFVGIDMRQGPGVDIVLNGHDINKRWTEPYFDLVTCCETFEHDNKFWITLQNMRDVLKPGGWLLISVPGINFMRHDYPNDYYRFTDSVFKEVFFEGYNNLSIEYYEDQADMNKSKPNNSLMGYAQKPL